MAPFTRIIDEPPQVSATFNKLHLNKGSANKTLAETLKPGKLSTGTTPSTLLEKPVAERCLEPRLSVLFAEECPF